MSWYHADVDAVRQRAGVGDQTDECPNGSTECPGPDADVGVLPCFGCLVDSADRDREVATDGGEIPRHGRIPLGYVKHLSESGEDGDLDV